MDKKIDRDVEVTTDFKKGSPQEEGKKMPVLTKQQSYEGLFLSAEKLQEITVKPKVKDGKILFDKKNQDHCYIVEEEY